MLVGVENFFSDFACNCERKKELRKQSGQPNFQCRSYAPLFHSHTHTLTNRPKSLGEGVPRGVGLFHQHFPHPSSSSFTALHQVYLSKRYNRSKGAGAARLVGTKGEGHQGGTHQIFTAMQRRSAAGDPSSHAPDCRSRRGRAPQGSPVFSPHVEARSDEDRGRGCQER